ncbi:MAG: radical SAM protein [Verrucomicrobiota bacterium]
MRMPYRMREPAQVAREIREDGQPYVVFIDNNLGSRRDYLHALCRALGEVGIIWSAAVTLDVTDDPGLVRAMALSGCTGVFVGFESLSDANLAHARKRSPRADDYARRVRLFHENGIQVNGSFVLGFDDDGPEVFARTAAPAGRLARGRALPLHVAALQAVEPLLAFPHQAPDDACRLAAAGGVEPRAPPGLSPAAGRAAGPGHGRNAGFRPARRDGAECRRLKTRRLHSTSSRRVIGFWHGRS